MAGVQFQIFFSWFRIFRATLITQTIWPREHELVFALNIAHKLVTFSLRSLMGCAADRGQ
eukprot:scaffold95652_cov53-Attheya_sp.AAC.1